jgi:hypothetical protein
VLHSKEVICPNTEFKSSLLLSIIDINITNQIIVGINMKRKRFGVKSSGDGENMVVLHIFKN